MLSHLALWTPARLQILTEFQLDGLHLRGDGLQGVLVPLLAFQSLIERALLFTDLKQKRDITKRFLALYLLGYDTAFLTAFPLWPNRGWSAVQGMCKLSVWIAKGNHEGHRCLMGSNRSTFQ